MRIHTNVSENVIRDAAAKANVTLDTFSKHNSRKAANGYEIILSGDSRRRQNGGSNYAATWDQWGVFLSHIFVNDPKMSCWAYKNDSDFYYQTDGRFDTDEWPDDYHGDHKWEIGIPYMQTCKHCTAVKRWSPRSVTV